MRKKLWGGLMFAITIVVLITILKIINWLPMALQKDTMRRYNSIEDIGTKLNIKEIHVPSYFPLSLRWPPSELLAQGRPFKAILMEFRDVDNGETALVISQAAVGSNFDPYKKIKLLQIKEKINYPLKGRATILAVGVCKNDKPCSQISWDEGKYTITVIMKTTAVDLINVVDSMIR